MSKELKSSKFEKTRKIKFLKLRNCKSLNYNNNQNLNFSDNLFVDYISFGKGSGNSILFSNSGISLS
jgi:hypothetical protein